MFKCEICKKKFEIKFQLVGHSRSHKKTQKEIFYEKNPKMCLECNIPIPYYKYSRRKCMIFCSCSCRAKNNHDILLEFPNKKDKLG